MTLKKSNKKPGRYYRNDKLLLKVGSRIQQLITEKDITHEIFYNDTTINPHRLIVGKMNMTLSTFSRICEYLQVSPEEFFKGIK